MLFEERYGVHDDGSKRTRYYVKESCGIAAGMFITALHNMGLATPTHTPSPIALLTRLLGRGAHERPLVLFPVGFPVEESQIPGWLASRPIRC